VSAVSAAATLKALYIWLNKQHSLMEVQGAVVMVVLPLVIPLHSAFEGGKHTLLVIFSA